MLRRNDDLRTKALRPSLRTCLSFAIIFQHRQVPRQLDMALILLSWALLQSTAMARESVRPGRPTSGFAALSVADHSPNSTHTVSFEHAGLGTWNWTVRVSDVNMPNASLYQLTDAHVAYTTHSFTWPSGGTLDDALQAEVAQKPELAGSSSCALLVDALFPLNVTEKYDPTSSDCTGMLGAECVKALTDLIGGIRSDCSDFSTSTTAVSQSCGGTFGVALGDGYGFSSARTLRMAYLTLCPTQY